MKILLVSVIVVVAMAANIQPAPQTPPTDSQPVLADLPPGAIRQPGPVPTDIPPLPPLIDPEAISRPVPTNLPLEGFDTTNILSKLCLFPAKPAIYMHFKF